MPATDRYLPAWMFPATPTDQLLRERMLRFSFRRIRGWMRPIEIVSGAILVVVGILIATNYFAILASYLNRWLLPLFPFVAENI